MSTTQHWSTPIYHSNLNDPQQVEELLSLADRIVGRAPSPPNVEDYGTAAVFDRLAKMHDPVAMRLFDSIRQHVGEYTRHLPNSYLLEVNSVTKIQLCILQPGEVTAYHGHDYSYIVGIVYLSPQNTGLILHDPRVNAARGYPSQFRQEFADVTIVPKPGDVVIFPSYVYHSTMVHNGDAPRIVMPFNVMERAK